MNPLLLFALLAAPPAEAVAYFPGNLVHPFELVPIRVDVESCRLVQRVEWSVDAPAKVVGTSADGLVWVRPRRVGSLAVRGLVRGGACRGQRVVVWVEVRPKTKPFPPVPSCLWCKPGRTCGPSCAAEERTHERRNPEHRP